jgi:hypothetical protein
MDLTPSTPPGGWPSRIHRDRMWFRVRCIGHTRENDCFGFVAIGLSPSFPVRVVDSWGGGDGRESTSPGYIP